jgi:arabinose-5-phosphate isomerase
MLNNHFSLDCKVEDIMSKNPKIIKDKNILASEALEIIENYKIQLLLVLEQNNKLIGVLHIHSLIEAGIK